MSDAVSFTELDGQYVELLAARTVLSWLPGVRGGQGGSASSGNNLGYVINDVVNWLPSYDAVTNAKGGNS